MFTFVIGLNFYSKEVEGGKYIRGRLESCVSVRRKEVDFGKAIWKES